MTNRAQQHASLEHIQELMRMVALPCAHAGNQRNKSKPLLRVVLGGNVAHVFEFASVPDRDEAVNVLQQVR